MTTADKKMVSTTLLMTAAALPAVLRQVKASLKDCLQGLLRQPVWRVNHKGHSLCVQVLGVC